MIIVNLETIIGLALLALCVVVVIVLFVVDRIACAIKKRQQKRIDDAYKEGR